MKKILIIRFSSIGDIVLTTPVIRCLKKQTGANIHFLTKHSYLPLLEANPYLDKIFTIEKKVGEVLPKLKAEQYDCIIDLHKNLRSTQVRFRLAKKIHSFDKLNFEKWLLVNFHINRLPKVHIVDRYFQAIAPLSVENDGEGLDYFFPKNIEESWQNSPNSLPPKYIAFAIGAAHQTKRLPANKILEICERSPLPVVLLGGQAESSEGERIQQNFGKKVTNYCGHLGLHESAKVIQNAYKVISHDTGMMHIAAALGKEILSIWGSTIPDFGMTPYLTEGQIFEVPYLNCRPCSKIGFNKCPKGHFRCMKDQDSIAISQALD